MSKDKEVKTNAMRILDRNKVKNTRSTHTNATSLSTA